MKSIDLAEQDAAAYVALNKGKPVQCQMRGVPPHAWVDAPRPTWRFTDFNYRPAPEPKTELWSKPEHVPGPVCWLRLNAAECEMMVTVISDEGVWLHNNFYSWVTIEMRSGLYSTDRATWLPCTVKA